MSMYGITRVEYEQLLVRSAGKCEICGTHLKKINIDYDPATGQVRGLLCTPCNTALAAIDRIPNWHMLAAQYIQMASQHKKEF